MKCAEFQKVLPYIIESGGNTEEEQHLRECPVCSDLVADLKYIAEQAKLLVPMEEPSPKVWEEIKGSLEREGMIRPARARGRLLGPSLWLGTLAALIVVALAALLIMRQRQARPAAETAEAAAPVQTVSLNPVAVSPQDDEQLLKQVAQQRPGMAASYQQNLEQVNAAIADAQSLLKQSPGDQDAREALMQAYEQKSMLYELATESLR